MLHRLRKLLNGVFCGPQGELFDLQPTSLEHRSNDVPSDCSKHLLFPLCTERWF